MLNPTLLSKKPSLIIPLSSLSEIKRNSPGIKCNSTSRIRIDLHPKTMKFSLANLTSMTIKIQKEQRTGTDTGINDKSLNDKNLKDFVTIILHQNWKKSKSSFHHNFLITKSVRPLYLKIESHNSYVHVKSNTLVLQANFWSIKEDYRVDQAYFQYHHTNVLLLSSLM